MAEYDPSRDPFSVRGDMISDEMREIFFSERKHLLKHPTDATQEIAVAAAQVNQEGAGVSSGRQTPIDEEGEIQNVEETTDQNFVSDDREREIRNVAAEAEREIQELMSLGEVRQQENEIQETAADDQEDSETHFPPLMRSEKTAVEKPQEPTHHVEEPTQETESEDRDGVVSARQTQIIEPRESTDDDMEKTNDQETAAEDQSKQEQKGNSVEKPKKSTNDDDVEKTTDEETAAEESKQEEKITSVEKSQKATDAEETTDEKVSDEEREIEHVQAAEAVQEDREIQEAAAEEARPEEGKRKKRKGNRRRREVNDEKVPDEEREIENVPPAEAVREDREIQEGAAAEARPEESRRKRRGSGKRGKTKRKNSAAAADSGQIALAEEDGPMRRSITGGTAFLVFFLFYVCLCLLGCFLLLFLHEF